MTTVPTGVVTLVLTEDTLDFLHAFSRTIEGQRLIHQLDEFRPPRWGLVQVSTGVRVTVVDLRAIPEQLEGQYLAGIPMAVKVGDPPDLWSGYFAENADKDFSL
jgi:hypothetical protein